MIGLSGEWLNYTVNVPAAGSYEVKFRTSRATAGDSLVRLVVGGADKTGDVPVPSTGSWGTWRDVTKVVTLSPGVQLMCVYMPGGQFNLNWIELRPTSAPNPTPTPTPAPTGRLTYGNGDQPWAVPASGTLRIQAENFDKGGQGVAYNDTTAGNQGGQYRTGDRVDIESAAGGGHNVGYVVAGEWLEYSANVAAAGSYELKLRVARKTAGSSALKLLSGGVDKTGDWAVASTGAWQAWTEITRTVALAAGPQVLRLQFVGAEVNVDWLELKNTGSGGGGGGSSAVLIYDDTLPGDWQDWSWGSTRNFGATTAVKSGARSLDLTLYPYGALSLRKDVAQSTAGLRQIHFWVYNGGTKIVPFQVQTQTEDTAGQSVVAPYSAAPGAWTEVWIPFTNLGSPASIKRLTIQEVTGFTQPTLSVDKIELLP
jgi:hypothetical protein